MLHEEDTFSGVKDYKIYYQKWIPDKPKAVIQLVHGFGEHSGRYGNVVDTVTPLGYAIYADDHRGHGRSEGQRNYVDSFEQYIEDEKKLFDIIRKENPDLPIFMLGHSMGSIIAVHFAAKHESLLNGLIVSGVGNDVGGDVGGFMRFLAKVMSKLAPKLMVEQGDLSKYLSHDQEVVEAYNNDPNVNADKTSARLGAEMFKYFGQTPEIASKLGLPVLVQAGGEDKLVVGAEKIEPMLNMEDKEVHIYEGLYHEVYNESEDLRKPVLEDLANWLESQMK